MNDTMEDRDILIRIRDEEMQKLADLAHDRRAAEAHLTRIRALDRSIWNSAPTMPSKYARHKSAIHAILDYLDEVGHPVPDEEMIKAITEGGWRGGREGADTMLRKSIGSYVSGRGQLTKQIKRVNGLVGRGEWPDELFVSPVP